MATAATAAVLLTGALRAGPDVSPASPGASRGLALSPRVAGMMESGTRGTASWYDDGPGFYAAVPSYRWGDPVYAIEVCRADDPGRCATVAVRDFCGCPDGRIIDLSPAAFARLAPLERGLVGVVIRRPELPATDAEA